MTLPGTRQKVAQIIARHLEEQLKSRPVAPMPTPCEPGFMSRKQAS